MGTTDLSKRPLLGIFGRRPLPDFARLSRYGASVYVQMGPWTRMKDGRQEVYLPVSEEAHRVRARSLAEMGIERWVLGWPPTQADAVARWAQLMGRFCLAADARVALVDHEPVGGRNGPGWSLIESATTARMVYGALKEELPIHCEVGITHVSGPTMDGVQVGMDESTVVMPQTYKADPPIQRNRIEQAHRAALHARLCVAVPGFGDNAQAHLPAYIEELLKAEAPVEALVAWSETQLDEGEWLALQAATRRA